MPGISTVQDLNSVALYLSTFWQSKLKVLDNAKHFMTTLEPSHMYSQWVSKGRCKQSSLIQNGLETELRKTF